MNVSRCMMRDLTRSSYPLLNFASRPNHLRTSRSSSLDSLRSGPLRPRFGKSRTKSRQTLAVSSKSKEPTIRGNVETYIQHLVPATDLKQFSDRVSGALNENSKKQEEFKLQLSRVVKCVKDLHDKSLGPNPRDMQEQFMKLVLRVNEINMQIAELREQPPAACGSSSAGAASTAGTGSWEKSGDTDPLTQGRTPKGSPPRDVRTVSSARPPPPPPPSGPPPPSPSAPIFGRDPSRTRAISWAAGAAPDNRARCAHEEPGHPQHREPRYPCRSCGKSVCEDCFDHDCNS